MSQSVRVVVMVVTVLLSVIGLAWAQTGELTIAVATDPITLDPRGAMNVISWSLAYHIADPLVGKDKDLKIVPLLAESWDRPDPLTWRFKLRRGAKFQNGEDVTAQAVKATLDVMIDPELAKAKKVQVSSIIRGNFRTVERVEAPDPSTVVIKTKTTVVREVSEMGGIEATLSDGTEAHFGSEREMTAASSSSRDPGSSSRRIHRTGAPSRFSSASRFGSFQRTPPG